VKAMCILAYIREFIISGILNYVDNLITWPISIYSKQKNALYTSIITNVLYIYDISKYCVGRPNLK